MENYERREVVGEGSFGTVYKGRRRFSGVTVAMKFIVKAGKSERDLRALRSELAILKSLRHPRIILLLDHFETPQELCVVTEFARGELFEVRTVVE